MSVFGKVTPPGVAPAAEHVSVRDAREPSQPRGQKRVDAILDAAEQLIAEQGMDAATMNAISERAGASIGSLYHFFPNREAIFQELALRLDKQSSAQLFTVLTPDNVDMELEPLFRRTIMEQMAFADRYAAVAILWDAYLRDPVASGPFHELYQAILGGVRAFIAARAPRLPAAQLDMAAWLSCTVVRMGCQETFHIPPKDRAAWLEEVIKLLVRYFEPLEAQYGRAIRKKVPKRSKVATHKTAKKRPKSPRR